MVRVSASDREHARIDHRPTPLASTLSLVLAAVSTLLLVSTPGQQLAVLGTLLGVALVVVDGRSLFGLDRLPTYLLAAAGVGLVVWSVAHGVTAVAEFGARAELVPGLVGLVLLGLGVRPLSQRFARRFVSAGLAALVVGVLLAGVFQRAGPTLLLAAAASAVVAWDLGEHGIGLGEQLRADARTREVELLHGGASASFGAVLVVAATLLFAGGGRDLPLSVLALLLAAAVVLMAALYR
ncbi:DUF7519 family protein [Haloarcula marina]|uniref:DUF7519 family protein n=1 Tax=Haloarcula marina TaxID=2961574 RepID=UPI0020B7C215|nr:hypothetical protein [Halomicroarcula marina]